ncbi:MAG: hypothetical protein ACOXZ1_03720 [Patescibacteria group bacterium]|jgi:hypothetical protein
MALIYILLGIIAVGVLLASENGKKVLFWIIVVLAVAGLGYLVFWLIIAIIAIFSNENSRNNVVLVLGGIMVVGYFGYELSRIYNKVKRGELTKRIVKKFFLNKWEKDRNGSILFLAGFILILIFVVFGVLLAQ